MKKNPFIQILAISSFRNLWLSQLISQIFVNLLFFSLMIHVYEITRSNSAVSFLVLLVTIPNILLGAIAGVIVDRSDRKIVMFLSHFLRIFAVLAFLISSETLGWLYTLIFLASCITQFFFPAEAATISSLVKDKKLLLTANSLFTLTFFASVIIGNVLAGPFLRIFGVSLTFYLVAIAFLISAIFIAQIPGESIRSWLKRSIHGQLINKFSFEETKTTLGHYLSDFLGGINHIYKDHEIKKAIIVMGISQILIGVLGSIAPGFADKILRFEVADVSLLVMAPAALGMILGAIILGQYLQNSPRTILVKNGLFVLAGSLGIFTFVDVFASFIGIPILPLCLITLTITGFSNAFLTIPVNTVLQENTPEELRSRIFGVLNTAVGIGSIIPIILAGVFADVLGVRFVMLATSILMGYFAIFYSKDNK